MGPDAFTLFGFPIKYYSLMYILALLVAIRVGKYEAKKYGIAPKLIEEAGTWVIFSGIIGARITYIIGEWSYYKDNLIEIIAIWRGIRGLAIHGGILGAAIGILLFSRKYKISVWRIFDIAVAPTLLGQAFGRIGNLMNGEAHGVPTFTPLKVLLKSNFSQWWLVNKDKVDLNLKELVPWGIVFPPGTPAGDEFPNIPVHPTMIYEMILNVIGAALLFFYFRKKDMPSGYLAAIYMIMYAVIRTIVTIFRADEWFVYGINVSILFNILFVMIALAVFYVRRGSKERL